MIVFFAVALVLETTVVQGITQTPSCSSLQQEMLHLTGLAAGGTKAVEPSKFENEFALKPSDDAPEDLIKKKAYIVQSGQDDILPSAIVNGISYQLYSIEVIPINSVHGTVAMELAFAFEKPGEPLRDVSFFVPLLTVDKDNPDLNADFSKVLNILSSEPENGVHKITLKWFKPLMEQVISAKVPSDVQTTETMENVKLYLTNCENVAMDTIFPFFQYRVPI